MTGSWPRTDVVKDIRTAAHGSVVTARTDLYLQGDRHHVHTTTILIAVDQVFSRLLHEGERLPDIVELQNRNLSNRNLVLSISEASERVPRVTAPAIRGSFRTDRGRTFFVEAAVSEDVVRRREPPADIFAELMERMHLEAGPEGMHRTRLEPLSRACAECPDPVLARHAIIELVLEGTRQRIRERFGHIAGQVLVVAGWQAFALPRWEDVAAGCVLEYALCDGRLSSGSRLVHCDFSFSPGRGTGRLTIGCAPAARMDALERRGAAPQSRSAGRSVAAPRVSD